MIKVLTKEAVLGRALPPQPSNVHNNHVPEPHATANYMQLTTLKRADAQVQYCTQLYTHLEQHATEDQGMYDNMLINYEPA